MSWFSNLFSSGSGSSGGGSSGSGWWGAILSGVSSYASSRSASKGKNKDSKDAIKLVGLQGLEARKTSAFERELDNYYKQKDNLEKRNALDTYGSFSKLSTYAPAGYTLPAKPVVPTKPSP